MLLGIDFAFGNGLTTTEIKNAGYKFVGRYLSGGNSKDISKAELDNYKLAGIAVILVWEVAGQEFTQTQGEQDAHAAQAELDKLGASDAKVFFAQDLPESSGVNPVAYMAGVTSVLGKARTGLYADYATMKAVFDAGHITYGWQTSGGSGGAWDDRALIRQDQYNVHVGPATVDVDQAAYWNSTKVLNDTDDYGQYPAPKVTPPPPPKKTVESVEATIKYSDGSTATVKIV